jgi:PAS domain S-box-containing protein
MVVTPADFQAFDAVGALVVVLDVDGRIAHWNQPCSEVTGYALDEVRGRRLWDFLLDSEAIESQRMGLATPPTAQPPSRFAGYWVTKSGERRWITWSSTITPASDGRPGYSVATGITATTSDATSDLREANQHMVMATIQAQEQTEEAETARALLAESERELREIAAYRETFIGVLGHDLRNPIAAINMTVAAMLADAHLDKTTRDNVARILSCSRRMGRMISRVLDLTRARLGGGFALEPRPIDLGELCQTVVGEFEAPVHLEVEGDMTGVWDPDLLAEALSNILGNAVEHAAPGTAVVIEARADGPHVVVEIANQGEPIPADVLPFIFEPFRRARQQRSASGNLGLGLYIASEIVQAGSGTLAARSAGGTTTFLMRLPRQAPPAESRNRRAERRA